MTGIRKLIWVSWFIGTGLIVLSYLRLVNNEVGMYGLVISSIAWMLSAATSNQSHDPE